MKFAMLATIKPSVSTDEFQRLAAAEGKSVWDLHKRGILESIFHREDIPGVVSIMESSSKEALQQELTKLPLHQHLDIQLFPLKPYDGYEAIWTHS